jgi:hypothetical protein
MAPIAFFATASGLIIEKVRSKAMIDSYNVFFVLCVFNVSARLYALSHKNPNQFLINIARRPYSWNILGFQ